MNRVSFVLFFKESRPGLANILRARAQIFYNLKEIFSRTNGKFEEHNILESFTIIIKYFTIINNVYYSL